MVGNQKGKRICHGTKTNHPKPIGNITKYIDAQKPKEEEDGWFVLLVEGVNGWWLMVGG